jgi:transposase-like protein
MAERKECVEAPVQTIRRLTRKKHSAEENVQIVLEGLRGKISIAALCRREGIPSNLYYRWSKDSPRGCGQGNLGTTKLVSEAPFPGAKLTTRRSAVRVRPPLP